MKVPKRIVEKVLQDPLMFGKPQKPLAALRRMKGEVDPARRETDGEEEFKPAVDARKPVTWQKRTLRKAFKAVQDYPDRPPFDNTDDPAGRRE